MNGYPRGFAAALWATLALLLITGALLVPGALELRCELTMPWRLPGGTRLPTAAAHAAAAFVFVAFFGALAVVHMRAGLRRKMHRISGVSLAAITAALVATGWGVYYAGEGSAALVSALHMILGGAGAAAVSVHLVRAKSEGGRDDRR